MWLNCPLQLIVYLDVAQDHQTWLVKSSKTTCLKIGRLNQLLGLLSHIFRRQPVGGLGGLIFKSMAVKIKLCAASIKKIVKLPASWHCWLCSHPHPDPVSLQNIRARTLQGTGFNLSFGRLPGSLCNKYMLVDGDKVVFGSYRWGGNIVQNVPLNIIIWV